MSEHQAPAEEAEYQATGPGCIRITIVGCALVVAFSLAAWTARQVPLPHQAPSRIWRTPPPAAYLVDIHTPTPEPADEDDQLARNNHREAWRD